jgi:hypothetical protein
MVACEPEGFKPQTGERGQKTGAGHPGLACRGLALPGRIEGIDMATVVITNANAGDFVVSDGDIYIIDPALTDDVTFTNPGGGTVNFEIQFNATNGNSPKIEFSNDGGMNPTVTVGDGVNLAGVEIDASRADSSTVNIGNNVELGSFTGSATGDDTITAGDNFDLDDNLDLGEGQNSFTAGDDFNADGSNVNVNGGDGGNTFVIGANGDVNNITLGEGEDTIELGAGSVYNDIKTKGGDDEVTIGDGVTGNNIDLEDGNDTLNLGILGDGALNDIKGGNDSTGDTLNTQTDPALVDFANNIKEFENTNVVCFACGTRITTEDGDVAVEDLQVGTRVPTLDHGLQPILWIGRTDHDWGTSPAKQKPVLISKGSLGAGVPARDLIVSPQHRLLADTPEAEVLVPAKGLLGHGGIRQMKGRRKETYFHILFERHEVILAEGVPTESLFPGPEALRAIAPAERARLRHVLGAEGEDAGYAPARPFWKVRETARHFADGTPIWSPGALRRCTPRAAVGRTGAQKTPLRRVGGVQGPGVPRRAPDHAGVPAFMHPLSGRLATPSRVGPRATPTPS